MHKYYHFLALSLLLLACNQKTVEQEMDEYCACRKEHRESDNDFSTCSAMMEEISRKYEFDPEAALVIREKLKACNE
jgi:hypothetical protein